MRASLLVRLVCFVIVTLAITPANAGLYSCKDGSGKTVFQDMPCPGTLEDAEASYNTGDFARAIHLFRPFAEKGNALAQSYLGSMYGNGYGVTQDYQEAVKWWRLAAAQGNDGAQNFLGLMYANGYGVAQSDQEAAKWWQLAAAQRNAQAQENLNALYEKAQAGRDLLAKPAPGVLTDFGSNGAMGFGAAFAILFGFGTLMFDAISGRLRFWKISFPSLGRDTIRRSTTTDWGAMSLALINSKNWNELLLLTDDWLVAEYGNHECWASRGTVGRVSCSSGVNTGKFWVFIQRLPFRGT